jgi:UDP-N-acetylmuramoylalanine--D-glutamate ligase
MHIQDLNGKKICILGFGKEGQAMLNALEEHNIKADITIADAKEAISDKRLAASYQLGNEYLADLDRFDVIIKSPGIPVKAELEAVKDKITSGTQIFFDSVHATGAMIIGITGSKGKSTTSSLIFELVKAHGKDVYLIGNIGKPVIEYISAAKAGTIFVEEMSSYQLMDLTVSPHIAVVTSFFPEHLDYHGSLEAYKDAKKHIARFQSAEDTIFYNAKSPGAIEIAEESKGQHVPFSDEDAPVQIEDTHLLGVHNLSNIAGAFKVARSLGVPVETCIQVFKDFHGLPHRLQSLGIHHDIEWIDDAISTTPESAIAALDALGDRVQTIILGGQDRGVDFKELGKRVAKSKVKTVILFPGSGPRVFEAIVEAVPQNPPSPNPFPLGGRGNEEYVHDVKKPLNDTVLYHAREMRKEPTAAEKVLWEHLRFDQLGVRFRRQHPVDSKIIDFYCHEAKLGVEVDGGIHDSTEQKERDAERTQTLEFKGMSIIRFSNDEVMKTPKKVVQKIKKELLKKLPSPRGGRAGDGGGPRIHFFYAQTMEEAVRFAKDHTLPGFICLLSTASPSYGMFKNFEEKGDQFAACIRALE